MPNVNEWEENRLVPKEFWRKAGEIGMLCPTVPEAYGGLGLDFGYNAIVDEEMAYNGVPAGFSLQSDIVCGYIDRLRLRRAEAAWLPRLVSGETITAIAMTEPGTGCDLQAIRTTREEGRQPLCRQRLKTYITNGQNADLIAGRRQDRSRRQAGVQGHVDHPGRERPRGLQARAQARQDRAGRRRHRRNCSSRTSACR